MLMCLVPAIKNKASRLEEICKMLKKEELFDAQRIDTFKAVINLEIDNLLTADERKKLKGKIKMSPQTQKAISDAISEVGRKYEYLEKQDLINKGKKDGIKEGKEEVAKNLKDLLSDEEISQHTGLDLQTVKNL